MSKMVEIFSEVCLGSVQMVGIHISTTHKLQVQYSGASYCAGAPFYSGFKDVVTLAYNWSTQMYTGLPLVNLNVYWTIIG